MRAALRIHADPIHEEIAIGTPRDPACGDAHTNLAGRVLDSCLARRPGTQPWVLGKLHHHLVQIDAPARKVLIVDEYASAVGHDDGYGDTLSLTPYTRREHAAQIQDMAGRG